jgi:cytochrome c553
MEEPMDMKSYFRRIREVEASIVEKDAVIVSAQTADGGREGVITEVPRAVAARLVAEGRARLASNSEGSDYLAAIKECHEQAEEARRRARPSLAVITAEELSALRGALKVDPQAK